MDVEAMRKFAGRLPTRPVLVGAAACTLLAVPLAWTVRQSRLTREALDRAAAAEKVAAQVRSELERSQARLQGQGHPAKDRAVRRSRHDDPKEIERVRQLHAEIDNLTHIQERVEGRIGGRGIMAERTAPAGRDEGPGAGSQLLGPGSPIPRP